MRRAEHISDNDREWSRNDRKDAIMNCGYDGGDDGKWVIVNI